VSSLDTPAATVKMIPMVSSLDEGGSCTSYHWIADDSPLLAFLPLGSTERDKAECVRKLLQLALKSEDDL
jgi:hypothetical protein